MAGSQSLAGLPTVTIATSVWERDWKVILGANDYLKTKQIQNHGFRFAERLLVINNVSNPADVLHAAQTGIEDGVLSRTIVADDVAGEVLRCFALTRSDFNQDGRPNDWLYYNALAPLTAIYTAQSDYILYMTGDCRLAQPVSWIPQALRKMEATSAYKVANLTWNGKFTEALHEADSQDEDFYIASHGFSDQMFLAKVADLRQPIYGEIRPDAAHFPHGDTFKKRCFSYMKNHGWIRLTYKHGAYTHRNIETGQEH
ncbi:MAG: hypothetical protein NXI27_09340 [Alphaproteobacteria bacterium]|nr:hypothetical protein [Alphaproteobacteria bacterium]